ncbi:hypothetical protein L9F63_007011, partial [Diploptera punctata]
STTKKPNFEHLEKPLELTIWEMIYTQKNKFRSMNFKIPDERDLISKNIKYETIVQLNTHQQTKKKKKNVKNE